MSSADLLGVIPLGYEEDSGLRRLYERSWDLTVAEVLDLIYDVRVLTGHHLDVRYRLLDNHPPCWILQIDKSEATASPARKAQLAIANHIGLMPAAFYSFLNVPGGESYAQLHRKDFLARCEHFHPHCIRPSHLYLTDTHYSPIRTKTWALSASGVDLRLKGF